MDTRQAVIKKIQLAELDMLKVFQEICKKHNLRYFAVGGTCIGATKYCGFYPWKFIAWEDDIELAMPYEDYVAFLDVAQRELKAPYSVLHPMNCMEEPLSARMINTNADVCEEDKRYLYDRAHIDIRPICGLPNAQWKRKLLFKVLKLLKGCNYDLRFGCDEKLSRWRKQVYAFFKSKPYNYFTVKQDARLKKYPFEQAEYVFYPWRLLPNEEKKPYVYKSDVFPHELFQSSVEVPFEDMMISVPVGYEQYISMDFGDLDELPRVEQKLLLYRRNVSFGRPLPRPRMFMEVDTTTLRKQQLVELGILKAFQEICQRYGLRYYAAYGTCIGAIRHNGFIPWDDDLDVAMPYEDYVKFFEIATRELPEQYSFYPSNSRIEERLGFIEMQDNRTTVSTKDGFRGVSIDIFAMHGLPREKWKQKILFRILKSLKRCGRIAMLNRLLRKYSFDESKECIFLWLPLPNEEKYVRYTGILKTELFNAPINIPFENTAISVPVGYDKFLRMNYGDYMTLPPEDERWPIHPRTRFFLDLDRPFQKYHMEAKKEGRC